MERADVAKREALNGDRPSRPGPTFSATDEEPQGTAYDGSEIAIIGMACRFPGADTPDAFWCNLQQGVESLTALSDEELRAAGVLESQIADPTYVRRASVIDHIEDFDARFFGYTPLEATIMDPQHRQFLECAWEVFERAGYNPSACSQPVGVFTGAKTNTYLFNVVAQRAKFPALDNFQIALGNDLAAMATRVSFKLDLRGPSYALHTACSTSLVAVHLACQSLLLDECSMAVAGGASINVPQRKGYPYAKGGILSSDGSCRTFDAQATGSNFGNGAGAVLLKPLANAIADGDHIHAVIRGSATNNDGAQKASFTAPGVEGQTEVLLEAMAAAGVTADDISYIEAHGTATDLGDSIEILALTEAFRASTQKVGSCAIGSAKTNLGHLEAAAGIAGLIKTALALEHRELPASLHFEQPNPCIDFASSPFVVNSQRRAWKLRRSSDRRIAGVSSFGIGSTNAHVILEQAPAPVPTSPDLPWQLLQLSARSSDALDAMTRNLGSHLQSGSREPALADVAYTLAVGRKSFEHRRAIVCRDLAEAKVALEQVSTDGESSAGSTGVVEATKRPVAFLMTGLGEHHVDMGLGLYRREPAFRDVVDRSAEILEPLLGMDLRQVLYPRGTDASEQAKADRATDGKLDFRSMLGRGSISTSSDAASARLDRTLYAQPALFIVEVALAELLRTHGITPAGMIGYSLGEYVCAHLAGVMSLQDALRLVARRAQLIDELPAGAMLAVSLAEDQMQPWLDAHDCSLAAVNGVTGCVAAGTLEAVSALELALGQAEVTHRRLVTTHAFHSHLMRPIASAWASVVEQTQLAAPTLPYVSNVTGTWIRDEEATDPAYWVRHLCQPVRFVEGLGTLLATAGEPALLEVGPGQSLCSFARLHPDGSQRQPIFATLRSRHGGGADAATFLNAVGNLWTRGVEIDSGARFAGQRRQRAPLPTYPFERQRHWLDPAPDTLARTSGLEVESTPADGPIKLADLECWLHRVVWKQSPLGSSEDFRAASEVLPQDFEISGLWLLVADHSGVAKDLGNRLSEAGAQVVMASAGDAFDRSPDGSFQLRLDQSTDFEQLFEALGRRPDRIVHLGNLAPAAETAASPETHFAQVQKDGFYSLIAMAQALGGRQALSNGLEIDVITSGVEDVTGQEALAPERATVLGATLVLSQEHPLVGYRVVDFDLSSDPGTGETLSESESLVETLLAELTTDAAEGLVAYRNGQRFVRDFEPMTMPATEATTFRARGVYLITGGLGGIGLHLAEHLSRSYQARLILTRRTPLPPRETWDAWLADNAQRPADERDEATLQAITQVLNFEAMGSEVLVEAADVSDEKAMRHVIDNALKQFGALHGVVHAAGVLAEDTFKTAQLIDRDACERQFQPKAYGLYVLERVLEGIDLDFCTLYSSLSAILGGFGYIGYATANLFMDYFVARHNRTRDVPWQSVDWDSWHYQEDEAARSGLGTTLSELAMTPAEGVEALSRILTIDRPRRLVVSTGELRPRLDQWVELSQLRSASPASPTTEARPEVADPAELPQRIADVWCRILGNADFGHEDSFFDLGGNSLLAMQMIAELNRELQVEIAPMVLFDAPTVGALARHLQEASADVRSADGGAPKADARAQRTPVESTAGRPSGSDSTEIAVIGMSGRFPGAGSVDAFWENLCAGRESISFFTDEQLLASGVDPETLCDPQYVKARPILADVEHFDAALFGYSPREAEVMDPQHRLFLECAWEAFEDAGYDTRRTDQRVGVYAGASISSYMQGLVSNPDLEGSVDTFQVLLGNEKDSLTTRVSYKFDLRGPSMAIQTFCSTSLVAVHMACQGLNTGEADMALAGGISIIVPQVSGYRCQDGGINSHDGHVRAFDAKATGMVFGNGAGLVVLKRLDDALRDGDQIHAVIKGTAINNDGALKAGYSAASIDGQEAVVADALAASGIDPQTIGYVETHGSGTRLGDPVELTALTRAFRAHTDRRQFCAVGSVKTNVGHLDRAAGVTGLIKTVLALRHKTIPASLHFEQPNPEIDFAASPFYVNAELSDWPSEGPRRAGVTSLGIGGTNAHAVLEEAPVRAQLEEPEGSQLLVFSAHTENALDNVTARLADALEQPDAPPLADVAFTLQVGRRELAHRRTLVCRNAEEAIELLRGANGTNVLDGTCSDDGRQTIFLFPGQGSQVVGMARELYELEPVFQRELDRCAEILSTRSRIDLRELIYPESPDAAADQRLAETRFTQPALFAVEYALAKMWMAWGLEPAAMMGHSVGEYVAACLSGVFSLEDALATVAERGRVIQAQPRGAMLAIPLPETELKPWMDDIEGLSLAAINAPDRTVVAGPASAVAKLEARLTEASFEARRLHTSHAFHSDLLEPAVAPLVGFIAELELRAPGIPFISCVTGTWITSAQATDPEYWGAQLRQGVRFSDGIQELLRNRSAVFLEVGPGRTLTTLARRHLEAKSDRALISTLSSPREAKPADAAALTALGKLWLAGLTPDWASVHGGRTRQRVSLPTYPFEHRRHWIEPVDNVGSRGPAVSHNPEGWLFGPAWKATESIRPRPSERLAEAHWLVLGDGGDLATTLANRLQTAGHTVTLARPGGRFARITPHLFELATDEGDIGRLLEALPDPPQIVLDLRYLESAGAAMWRDVLQLAQELDRLASDRVETWIITDGVHPVLDLENAEPVLSTLPAVCRAVCRRTAHVCCRHIDLFSTADPTDPSRLAELILREAAAESTELTIAYRGRRRWALTYQNLTEATQRADPLEQLPETVRDAEESAPRTWLITGGSSEPGFSLANALVGLDPPNSQGPRLALIEPRDLPPREAWDGFLQEPSPTTEDLEPVLAELLDRRGIETDISAIGAELPASIEQAKATVDRRTVPAEFDSLADTLCAAHSYRFFARYLSAAASDTQDGAGANNVITRDELQQAIGLIPRFERFFDYLLYVLERARMVELDGERIHFRPLPSDSLEPEVLGDLIKERYPDFAPGIDCVAHCAAHYAEAFGGAIDPVHILFPGGSSKLLQAVMETQDRYSINRLLYPQMTKILRQAASELDRPLRILEIGAGEGNLTWEMAESLRGSNVEYHFTDIGRAFVVGGQKIARERGLDFMQFGVLDVTRDPKLQGYEPYSFDVLLAFDVVHATPDVRETMRNLKRLLSPGGWTMILEPTRDQHWISLIWGLAEGWWLYTDEDLRTLHPLLSPQRWGKEVLAGLGFSYFEVFPTDEDERATADHSLLIAQQPRDLDTDDYLELAADHWRSERRQTAQRIRRTQKLEKLGAEVEIWPAAEPAAISQAVRQARQHWGSLHGVLHIDGPWIGASEGLDELDPDAYRLTLENQSAVIEALEAGLEGERPSVAMLASSLAAAGDEAIGPVNAADSYLASLASSPSRALAWRSLVWGLPVDVGQGGGLPPELAAKALDMALKDPQLQRVVLTHRPPALMPEAWNRQPHRGRPGTNPLADTSQDSAAPQTPEEQGVARVWQQVLGIPQIGLHDNFFDLGGDSLITTQIQAQLHRHFGVGVAIEQLFEELTVAGQARLVQQALAEQQSTTEESILEQLTSMSDEDAEAELSKLATQLS